MKQVMHLGFVALAALSLLNSCTNSSIISPDPQSPQLSGSAVWKVAYFFDKDKDETSDFSGYTFVFHDSGSLEAVSGGTTTTGTWRVTSDDGFQRLVISIGLTRPLSELNDDWIIKEFNNQFISLMDDNTDHTEELHFARIP